MSYKWGYITALISFAFAPLLVVPFWEEPIPSNRFYADHAGDLRDAFLYAGYFVLAGIGVAFKKSFGWYMNYIGFGLVGLFMLGVGIVALIDVVNGGDECESVKDGLNEESPPVDSAEEDHEVWWKEAVKKSEEFILQTDNSAQVLFLITNIIEDMLRLGVPASILIMAVQKGFSFNEERSNGTE